MACKEECLEALDYLQCDIYNTETLKYCVTTLEQLIEDHFKLEEHTINFKHFKLHKDSTLTKWNKDDLIEYIHTLYNNFKGADLDFSYALNYINSLQNEIYRLENQIHVLNRAYEQKQERLDELEKQHMKLLLQWGKDDNKPLKFEDMKDGMWVWDDRLKACFLIKAIKPNTHWNIVIYTNYLTDTFEKIEFEEGRFYPLIKAMEGYKNG